MPAPVLDAETLFAILCRESYQDGHLDEDEALLLTDVRALLSLSPQVATDLLVRARQEARPPPPGEGRRFDRTEAFRAACRVAWADGELEDSERKLALGLADYLLIPRDQAVSMLAEGALEDL